MQTKFNNNYIVIDEFSNPEIKIVIDDKYEVPFKIRARWFCEKHSKKIVFIVLCIIIGIIAAIILVIIKDHNIVVWVIRKRH